MLLRKTFNDSSTLLRIGTVCLLIALFMQRFMHPANDFQEGLFDGLNGTLVGASIALNLLALRFNRKTPNHA
jgi:hypothetical protein